MITGLRIEVQSIVSRKQVSRILTVLNMEADSLDQRISHITGPERPSSVIEVAQADKRRCRNGARI